MTDIQFDRLRNSLTVEDCGEAGFPELFCVSQVNTLWGSFEINKREADEDDADTVCQVRTTSIYIPSENIFSRPS